MRLILFDGHCFSSPILGLMTALSHSFHESVIYVMGIASIPSSHSFHEIDTRMMGIASIPLLFVRDLPFAQSSHVIDIYVMGKASFPPFSV